MLAQFSHGHHMEIYKLLPCSEVVRGGSRPEDEGTETDEGVSMGPLETEVLGEPWAALESGHSRACLRNDSLLPSCSDHLDLL